MQLSIQGLSKQYRGNVWGLKDFSLTIENGVFGLLGPNGAGIARKKENSVAATRDNPKPSPPMMVAPERERPGNNSNSTCTQPIPSAVRSGI